MRLSLSRAAFLAVAALALIGAVVQQTGAMGALDRQVLDASFRFNRARHAAQAPAGPSTQEPVIVGIDEAFLDSVDEPLALNHVYLSRFLNAMARAKPRVVGIDLALPEKRFQTLALAANPGVDFHRTLLAGLLAATREMKVVAAKVWDTDRGKFRDIQVDYATVLAMQPGGATAHASALFCQDPDERVRVYPGPECQPGGVTSIFSSELAAAMGVRSTWSGLIDYQAGAPFAYLPLRQVLDLAARNDDATLQSVFAGRPVLLGTVLDDVDLITAPVPIAAWRPTDSRVPGVTVHAQMLRNMLGGGFVQPAPTLLVLVLAACFSLFWAGARVVRKFVLFAAVAMAMLALSVYLLGRGVWLPTGAMLFTGLLACTARAALEGWRGWRERRRLAETFSGYVSPAVMREILESGASHQEGRKLTVCVLFSDIRSFTTLSERMQAEEVVALLNRYFARMSAVVHRHGGTVDKFIGDGLMAFFGAPNLLQSPSRNAFDAAREMLVELDRLNREFQAEGRAPIAIGVGLHLGEAVIGSIGSAERHAYTAIGDSVNTASRLEGLCKDLGFPLVCSETVAEALRSPRAGHAASAATDPACALVPLGAQKVKGRSDVTVYGWRPPPQNAREDEPGALTAASGTLPGAAAAQ